MAQTSATPSPGAPPLKDLLVEGFSVLALLQAGAWPPGLEGLKDRLQEILAAFRQRALAQGHPAESVDLARYAFCALADEILLAKPSPFREEWAKVPLMLRLFDEPVAGEGFFRNLEDLRKEPDTRRDVLEVYRLCLLLGFQGKFLLQGPARRVEILNALERDLGGRQGGETAPLALPGFHHAGPAPAGIAPGLAFLLAFLAALLLFLAFHLALGKEAGFQRGGRAAMKGLPHAQGR